MKPYRLAPVALLFASGCTFNPNQSATADDDVTPSDAARSDTSSTADGAVDALLFDAEAPDAPVDAPTGPIDVVHVSTSDEYLGTGDLTLLFNATLATSGLGFGLSETLPAGVTISVGSQEADGPELAILHVRHLTIGVGAELRAIGNRPLVILAETVTLLGTLDAGGRQSIAGAGAWVVDPPGAGANGQGLHDSYAGGGGGSFGGTGSRGGHSRCVALCTPAQTVSGGGPGSTYGSATLNMLEGGSPGGNGFQPANEGCPDPSPGAGGGAIQVYARTSITIAVGGGINAGGGGGGGGSDCGTTVVAGHGGGSGGAIFIQTALFTNLGVMAANGGGGGGSAGADSANHPGQNGRDGALSVSPAAGGAAGIGSYSAPGGAGATTGAAANGGDAEDRGNGGGGGGGRGRIHIRYRTNLTMGLVSPTPTTSTY